MAKNKTFEEDFPTLTENEITTVNSNGLKTPLLPDLIEGVKKIKRSIYGNDINLEQNSPFGQECAILGKMIYDTNNNLAFVNSAKDPLQAVGRDLDDVVMSTNITRLGATFTQQNISVVIVAPCNLSGLDGAVNDVNGTGFTIADEVGTKYILATSQIGLVPGTYTLLFRAEDIGAIRSEANTITSIVTTVQGVESVNNTQGALSIGRNGETDAQLRFRHQRSPSQFSIGQFNGLEGRLRALEGVVDVFINNNNTDLVNQYGVSPRSIWTIVDGGSQEEIANELFFTISAGCGFFGNITVPKIDQANVVTYIKYERPITQSLYIRANLKNVYGGTVGQSLSVEFKNYIVSNLAFKIGQYASAGIITPLLNDAIEIIAPNQLTVSSCVVGVDGLLWSGKVDTTNINYKFIPDFNNIDIVIEPA